MVVNRINIKMPRCFLALEDSGLVEHLQSDIVGVLDQAGLHFLAFDYVVVAVAHPSGA